MERPEISLSRKRWARAWQGIFVLATALSIYLLLAGGLFRTSESMLRFSSTLAQVAITLVAIITVVLVYLAGRPDQRDPKAAPLLVFSMVLFIAAAGFALVDIALNPGQEGLMFADRARPITGAIFFLGGVALMHLGLIDLLEGLSL